MNYSRSNLIAYLMVIFLSLQLIGFGQLYSSPITASTSKISGVQAQSRYYKIDIQITAPTGYSMPEYTPIVFNLSYLADFFPETADTFGSDTPDDVSDNINWLGSYIVDENDSLIPSQIDNIDGKTGYTSGDELIFQLPAGVNLASEESESFSLYIGNKEGGLPSPVYSEVCTIYEYPYMEEVALAHGTDMLGEVYTMENGAIRASPLVDAAWSSGGMYHLSVLNETGGDSWDAIKQRFQFDWPAWKWARFATVEQFIELNDKAGTNPFFLPDTDNSIITGPVRARIQMRSIAPYGQASSSWGAKPGVFGLVTYELYANNPYLEYTLDITGPNAAENPTLIIEIQNREFSPGGAYSPYKSLYVPGKNWIARVPDDLDEHFVTAAEFTQSWYLEKLAPSQTMFPVEPDMDKLGFGMIFDSNGFDDITYKKTSEDVKLQYSAAEFPLHARYLPIDASISSNAISYMGGQYQDFNRPSALFSITSVEVLETELPFDYISVSRPEVVPAWAKVSETIDISNIKAVASTVGEIDENTTGATHTFQILDDVTNGLVLEGSLVWNSNASNWEAKNIDLSTLSEDAFYVARAEFTLDGIIGQSSSSKQFWYGDSDPPVDLIPPVISNVIQSPMATEVIRYTQMVNVSCLVSDASGISSVILEYNNGTWYSTSMEFDEGTYTGSIPSATHTPGETIQYRITATDNSEQENSNSTGIYSYLIALEYTPGEGLIPLLGLGGILIAAVVIALKSGALHKIKYDEA